MLEKLREELKKRSLVKDSQKATLDNETNELKEKEESCLIEKKRRRGRD